MVCSGRHEVQWLVMGAASPKQAIIDDLAGPRDRGKEKPTLAEPQRGIVRVGRLDRADLSTVRVVKDREPARATCTS